MESIIITVRLSLGSFEYDVEVSPNIPCGELAEQIIDAIRAKDSEIAKRVGANPFLSNKDGRRLQNDNTLGQMGLWDGSIIILGSET